MLQLLFPEAVPLSQFEVLQVTEVTDNVLTNVETGAAIASVGGWYRVRALVTEWPARLERRAARVDDRVHEGA